MSDNELAAKLAGLAKLASAYPPPAPRLEDHVMIFHAQCGGIVVGELGKPLTCAECGKEMTAFVSSSEEENVKHEPTPGKPRLQRR